jgi:hypothetical protein
MAARRLPIARAITAELTGIAAPQFRPEPKVHSKFRKPHLPTDNCCGPGGPYR